MVTQSTWGQSPLAMLPLLLLTLVSVAWAGHAQPLSTAEAAANCDPDYGWINGPEGTNKCYMILRDQAYSTCFSGGSNPDWNCDPANPECYTYCYNTQRCYDPYGYECGGGNYYSSFNWYEAQQCCVANHGFLAEPSSVAEHDLIAARANMTDQGAFVSYWLGGVDYFEEGTWQWANGDPFEYSNWHEGEPNNVDNEDCLSMSGQDGYEWMDLNCGTRDHAGVQHFAVCENRKG